MAGAIAQSKAAFSTAAVTSIAVSFTAQTATNAIWAVGHDGSGINKAMTCADTANGSYGTQLDSVNDSLNGNTLRHWVKANIASGSNTVTNTLPGSDGFSGIYAAEVSGVTTTPVDGHAGNTQPSLGTGTNNITSTAATNTATAFMLGLTIQDSSSSAGHASVGTGFTIDSNFASGFWNLGTANAGITEFKASVAAASNAALFSNGLTAQTYNTVMVMLDEATSGATGSAAITEGADTASGTGSVGVSGSAAVTEGTDTVVGTGAVGVSGSAAITEGADTVVGAGTAGASGSASITEGTDSVSASGSVAVSGIAAIQEGADAVAASGSVGVSGSGAITEGTDTVSATGSATTGAVGSAGITEDPDTVTASGSVGVSGSAGILEDGDIVLAQGSVPLPVGFSNDPGLGGSGGDRWSSKFEFSRRQRDVPRGTPSEEIPARSPLVASIKPDVGDFTKLADALISPVNGNDDDEAMSAVLEFEAQMISEALRKLQ